MKLPAAPGRRDDEKIGPLIDVVFLLLLFFMLAGTLAPPEPVRVDPPSSQHAGPAEPAVVRVLLAAGGQLAIGDRLLERAELRRVLEQQLAEGRGIAVELKADATVAAGEVLSVLDILREAGVEQTVLLTAGQP